MAAQPSLDPPCGPRRYQRVMPPVVWALVAQLGGGATAWLYVQLPAVVEAAPIHPMLLHSVAAAVFGLALRLPLWWAPINALFVPAAVYLQGLSLRPVWFLIVLVVLVLLFWTSYRTRVPLYLSGRRACQRLASLLPQEIELKMLDLGSGFGGVLAMVSRQRPRCRLVGLEIAPLPAWIARLRHLGRPALETRRRDFWRESLADYDLVYAYLSPEPMPALWLKVCAEMRPGTLFVSNAFAVPGASPDLVLPLGWARSPLYVWRL